MHLSITLALGSRPSYQILSHVVKKPTARDGSARISRELRAILAWQWVSILTFNHLSRTLLIPLKRF